jgi:hypothetical protein
MTLGCMMRWPDGSETLFIDKIWNCLLIDYEYDPEAAKDRWHKYLEYNGLYKKKFGNDWQHNFLRKYHSIRAGNRWKAEMDIHFVVHNRTKNRFQFAPIYKCVSVQKIVIDGHQVVVDENMLGFHAKDRLALNDGFNSVTDFYNFFNKPFIGQIVHWTNIKY